jgi:hypothetical protein
MYSYAFVNKKGPQVTTSYSDPYDAYQARRGKEFQNKKGKELCLVLNSRVVKILPGKLISVKWGVACAERLITPNNKCEQALKAVKCWIHSVETGKELEQAFNNVMDAHAYISELRASTNANTNIEIHTMHAMNNITYVATKINNHTYENLDEEYKEAHSIYCLTMSAVNAAANAATDKEKEVMWQRQALWKIMSDPFFELSKINYHENYRNLGLGNPFPFRDLGPKIMEYL